MSEKYEWKVEAMETVIPYKSTNLGIVFAKDRVKLLKKQEKNFLVMILSDI
jgi:hypothetical protein